MSNINVWAVDQDGSSGDEDEVRLPNVHKKSGNARVFSTEEDETLAAAYHILELLDQLSNGEAIVITKDT